jgi:hypothetical protein
MEAAIVKQNILSSSIITKNLVTRVCIAHVVTTTILLVTRLLGLGNSLMLPVSKSLLGRFIVFILLSIV